MERHYGISVFLVGLALACTITALAANTAVRFDASEAAWSGVQPLPDNCAVCAGPAIVVDRPILLSGNDLAGTADILAPFARFDDETITINLRSRPLQVTTTGRIAVLAPPTSQNSGTPNLHILSTCTVHLAASKRRVRHGKLRSVTGVIETNARGGKAGDITVQVAGTISVEGGLQSFQEVETNDPAALSGAIKVQSTCGDIVSRPGSWVITSGSHAGAGPITLQHTQQGNIIIRGAVVSHIDSPTAQTPLPRINVHAVFGNVVIDGGHLVVDDWQSSGQSYDLTSGLLILSHHAAQSGHIHIQARHDVMISRDVRTLLLDQRSFAAVATVATGTPGSGGTIRVRALRGGITVRDLAIQAEGLHNNSGAVIELIADKDVIVRRPVEDSAAHHPPTLSTASLVVGTNSRGGTNRLQSCDADVVVQPHAVVQATSVVRPGRNILTADNGAVSILGTVTPTATSGIACNNPRSLF